MISTCDVATVLEHASGKEDGYESRHVAYCFTFWILLRHWSKSLQSQVFAFGYRAVRPTKVGLRDKMNDNISPEDETALLADGNSDERVDAPQDSLFASFDTGVDQLKLEYDRSERIAQMHPQRRQPRR